MDTLMPLLPLFGVAAMSVFMFYVLFCFFFAEV